LDAMKQNGMEWLRAGVTTISSPDLRDTPPAQWSQLPFRTEYWSAREYTEQMMREAAARGMRLNLCFYLSDVAAHAGAQHAPPEWANLSVAETAALVEAYTFETTRYFMDKGLNVELYDIGNEIDFGILNFRPNDRIPLPTGVSVISNMDWMRNNVWNIESTLLKSAISGVKRANPQAKIVLHAAGIGVGRNNLFGEAFFQAMVDSGVDFDYAGFSMPYPSDPWDLDQYSTESWFQGLQELTDFIGGLKKQVIFSEGSYANSPEGQVALPMQEFPFTPAGQAAWVREALRFQSNNPNVAGWFYWYPDAYPGLNGGRQPPSIPPLGLFASETVVQPAMREFGVNLLKVTSNASPSSGYGPLQVSFMSSASGGTAPSYRWDFGDGSTAPGQNLSHVYSTSGSFIWKVFVTTDGITAFDTGTIQVAPAVMELERSTLRHLISPGRLFRAAQELGRRH
jgi:hypothetical protein